uniref:NADH dehydrogenase subunit 6 n=1 Tax=Allogalathea elegans TaxID=541025 RepID=UPI0021822B02|nr:NADH dehydrogenase subunit 6 [Allogalathea elegans]UVF62814.1 NADH dehydrogenase subunit 6 [Allogalathea elegans]
MYILLFILPIIIMVSLLFLTMTHPLSTGLTLLGQTILIAAASGLTSNSFWFSYILFLIFLGAMLVLFIYVASIASNEQFSFNFKAFVLFMLVSSLSLIMIFFDQILMSNKISSFASSLPSSYIFWTNSLQISPIYNMPSFQFTIFIILYLLLTLIVIVKIMNMYSSPLRLSY